MKRVNFSVRFGFIVLAMMALSSVAFAGTPTENGPFPPPPLEEVDTYSR